MEVCPPLRDTAPTLAQCDYIKSAEIQINIFEWPFLKIMNISKRI